MVMVRIPEVRQAGQPDPGAVEIIRGTIKRSETAKEKEKRIFESMRDELLKLDNGGNYWKTAHHLRISSMLYETEIYRHPLFSAEPFAYHLWRWMLWIEVRPLFWKVFQPLKDKPLHHKTVTGIIQLLVPFFGFMELRNRLEVEKYPLTRVKWHGHGFERIPYNLSLYFPGSPLTIEKKPYFLTPEIEKRSLLFLMDIFEQQYYTDDPDLRHYQERWDYSKAYKRYIIQSTRLLFQEGLISPASAYKRIAGLFLNKTAL